MVDTVGVQSHNTTALTQYIDSSNRPAAWFLDLEIDSATAHGVTSSPVLQVLLVFLFYAYELVFLLLTHCYA